MYDSSWTPILPTDFTDLIRQPVTFLFTLSRTSSVGKVDDSESGGPRFESRQRHL